MVGNYEIHGNKRDGQYEYVLVPTSRGFAKLDTSKNPVEIVFADGTSVPAESWENASKERVWAPVGIKKLEGI